MSELPPISGRGQAQTQQQQQQQQDQKQAAEERRTESQRRVNLQREIDRVKHVITRLAVQETRAHKRAQIIELRAREVEGVRHESERDYKVREQLMMNRVDQRVRQHEKVSAVREERKQRAESSRRDLRTHKLELVRLTKQQHKLISETLCETNAEHHDRNVQQHAAIRAVTMSSTARQRNAEKKREQVTLSLKQAADEARLQQEQLLLLEKQAKEMEQRVQNKKILEAAAGDRLRNLCLTNKLHTAGGASDSPTAQNPSAGQGKSPKNARDDHSDNEM